jgi:hypothetical protein
MFKSSLSIVFKISMVLGLMILGYTSFQITLKAVDTEHEFHFLDKNNRGVAGLLIQTSESYFQKDPQMALSYLVKASQVNVADGRIYLIAGLLYESLNEIDKAKFWMRESDRLGPRKPLNQMAIGQFWFRQHELDQALIHWMVALEMNPEFQAAGFKDLVLFMHKPLYLEALTRLVKNHHPLWWSDFFNYAASHTDDLKGLKTLYEARLSSGFAVTATEENALFERLMRDRQWADAYFTWLNHLPGDTLKYLGNIFDGGFVLPPSNTGFGWRIQEEAAYNVFFKNYQTKNIPNEAVIFFNGSRPKNDIPLFQYLLLESGNFKLTGEVMTQYLEAGEGLFWQISCSDGRALNQPVLFHGTNAWKKFETTFSIPKDHNCQLQRLNLAIRQDIDRPFRYTGSINMRMLNIERF